MKTTTVRFYDVFCPTFGLYHDELNYQQSTVSSKVIDTKK